MKLRLKYHSPEPTDVLGYCVELAAKWMGFNFTMHPPGLIHSNQS